ncbi:hypothetical protein Micbo1qcDRAFT_48270 [Microdochium bolleyi]|uniref:C2H2-type domain-containing protein n=1 Tax=Microdochium bolleyi TaxID=196109 RepID=A0A136ILE3_9PEZI|nr:hypothetical protein Micbo1qcDRAFT_48270 [Microdochium bolleyi]
MLPCSPRPVQQFGSPVMTDVGMPHTVTPDLDASSPTNVTHHNIRLYRSVQPRTMTGASSPIVPATFQCSTCREGFRTKTMLTRHIRIHTKPMKCPKPGCPVGADWTKNIQRHVWVAHVNWAKKTGFPPLRIKCDKCDKSFARQDGLVKHRKSACRR